MPEAAPRTTEHGDGITAIDSDLVRPIFDASHLVVENGAAAFVDCGANRSVPHILATLAEKDIDPASVTMSISPTDGPTRHRFSPVVSCQEQGSFELSWTATIAAPANSDVSNDMLTAVTEVLCGGQRRDNRNLEAEEED